MSGASQSFFPQDLSRNTVKPAGPLTPHSQMHQQPWGLSKLPQDQLSGGTKLGYPHRSPRACIPASTAAMRRTGPENRLKTAGG